MDRGRGGGQDCSPGAEPRTGLSVCGQGCGHGSGHGCIWGQGCAAAWLEDAHPPHPRSTHPWETSERTHPSLPGQCPSQSQTKDLLRPLFCSWSPPGSSAPGGARPGPELANGSCLLLKQRSIMQIDREMFKASCPVSMNYGLAWPDSSAPGSFWGSGCSESSAASSGAFLSAHSPHRLATPHTCTVDTIMQVQTNTYAHR